jgi:hypothetical protein
MAGDELSAFTAVLAGRAQYFLKKSRILKEQTVYRFDTEGFRTAMCQREKVIPLVLVLPHLLQAGVRRSKD